MTTTDIWFTVFRKKFYMTYDNEICKIKNSLHTTATFMNYVHRLPCSIMGDHKSHTLNVCNSYDAYLQLELWYRELFFSFMSIFYTLDYYQIFVNNHGCILLTKTLSQHLTPSLFVIWTQGVYKHNYQYSLETVESSK